LKDRIFHQDAFNPFFEVGQLFKERGRQVEALSDPPFVLNQPDE
jgi:hypothetical protein